MKALFRLLFDAICAMSLLVVVGSVASKDDPQSRNSPDATTRQKATTSLVDVVPSSPKSEPRRGPATQLAIIAMQPIHVPIPPKPEPVRVVQRENPAVGYSPLVPQSSSVAAPKPESQTDKYVRPYEREPIPIQPQCTPSRAVIMEYWRIDLVRARSLAEVANDAQVRRVLGATYKPLMNAIQRGANGGNNTPEPPESYAKVILNRYKCNTCLNGNPTHNGFTPAVGEQP